MRRGGRKPTDAEMDKEIRFHLEELTEAYVAQGVPREEARRRASLDFGGAAQVKQSLREVYVSPVMEAMRFHLRAAARFISHARGFAIAVILTFALGIGANSAIFSVLDAVVLRPLPYPASQQLMLITQKKLRMVDTNPMVSPVRLEDWNRLNSTFTAISGTYEDDFTETSGAVPERLTQSYVAPRFLKVMGVSPMLGRGFLPAEEHFGGPNAELISYRLWQRRFHGDPGVLGKQLHAGKLSTTIVGVMPPSFAYPNRQTDLWATSPPDAPYAQSRESTWYRVIGRLKPGVSQAKGLANLTAVQRQLGLSFPQTDAGLGVTLTPLKETVVGDVRDTLWILYGSVSLLLLIACSNISAMLLARTAEREHEIAVRFSLGAERRTVLLQLLTETLVLALLGSLLGLLIAWGAVRLLHTFAASLPRISEVALNWRVVAYSLLCALGSALLAGLYPALRGTKGQLAQKLATNARTQSAARNPLQWTLVGVQMALSVVLLTSATLLARSLWKLGEVSPGFDTSHVLSFQVSGNYSETVNMAALTQRIENTLEALRAVPGIAAAATTSSTPGMAGEYPLQYLVDGHAIPEQRVLAENRSISEGYFATMRIPLLAGMDCAASPAQNGYVVNQAFVNQYFAGRSPLEHTLTLSNSLYPSQGRILGVVGDAREQALNRAPQPMVYACFNAPGPSPLMLVRTKDDPRAMMETLRSRLHAIAPARSVYGMEPLRDQLDESNADARLRTGVLLSFAGLAVLLACVGLCGTLSYLGRLREREVGLRLTLGATRGQVGRLMLWQGARVAAIGCVAGCFASVFCTKLLTNVLYGVSRLDPSTYLAVLGFIMFVALLACAIPARRAALLEPTRALRAG